MKKSATLKDVAREAGVSLATASAALNSLAVVRESTRKRVEQAASRLGYRKDASAAVMATRRKRSRVSAAQLSLGYLVSSGAAHQRSEAFLNAARELGYDAEFIRVECRQPPEAFSRMLWNRRVAGLFIASPMAFPADEQWVRGFEWGRFAVVKFTRARPELAVDLIRHSAFDYMASTVREVVSRGYRRIGVLMTESEAPLDDEARLGALLGWEALRRPRGVRVRWRMVKMAGGDCVAGEAVRSWLRSFEPDAVIGFPDSVYWALKRAGCRIPGDFGFASVVLGDERADLAGCSAEHDEIARRAVRLLDEKIRLGATGFGAALREEVVEPVWREGRSLGTAKRI